MSSGLEAIANELKRLQREGVNRVFIEDHTLQLLAPAASAASAKTQTEHTSGPVRSPSSSASAAPASPQDLLNAIDQPPSTAATESPQPVKPSASPNPLPTPPVIDLPEGDATTQLAWLRDAVSSCKVCQEHLDKRDKLVFGAGSTDAEIFFCGEAPGTEDARTGDPFAGKDGQLLSKIITAMGLSEEKIYITNILKWRPEHNKPYGNRPPTVEEMEFCLPYLKAQIQIIQPKVIVALGNAVVTGLLGPDPDRKMGEIRGSWASFEEIPVMITFHPSYLLRNGTLKTKRMAWEDMLQVMEKCSLEITEKQRGFFLPKS